MEGVLLPHYQVLVLEDRTFHCKVLRRLYRNSKFNSLANFNLLCQLPKNFRVSRILFKSLINLLKDILNSERELN